MRLLLILVFSILPIAGSLGPASVDAFRFISIGDKDGFGFKDTKGLIRGNLFTGKGGAADANGNGRLDPGEFLPDINKE